MDASDKPTLMVRTSRNRLEPFDKKKIEDSLVRETGIDRAHAEKIAAELEDHVKTLKLKYLTAPLIREIVNVKLLENGFLSARMRYTRLGMPVYDTRNLIRQGIKDNPFIQHNPETVHHLMADVVAREYTYVYVLPPKLVDAHMSGRIHIHDLNFYATRPFTFSHDLRFFLKNGLKVDGLGQYSPAAGPPRTPEVAFLQAARILAASQKNCAAGSSIPFFNVYLAPYVRGLKASEIQQLAQHFIFEVSQIYPAGGKETAFPSINLNTTIPQELLETPVIQPGGKVRKSVTYGDFQDEARKLFQSVVDVYLKGDCQGNAFPFPKLEVHLREKDVKDFNENLHLLPKLTSKFGNPSYVFHRKYHPRLFSYQADSYILPLGKKRMRKVNANQLLTSTILQVTTLNLPRTALDAAGDEDKMLRLISKSMYDMKTALITKKDLIETNIQNKLLPFLGQPVGNGSGTYLDSGSQYMLFSFLGLYESIKILTGEGLDESQSSRKLGLKILSHMKKIVEDHQKQTGFNFLLSGGSRETTSTRMAEIDKQNFKSENHAWKNPNTKRPQYTPSFQLPPQSKLPLKERILFEDAFHRKVAGGCLSRFTLEKKNMSPRKINDIIKMIAAETEIQHINLRPLKKGQKPIPKT